MLPFLPSVQHRDVPANADVPSRSASDHAPGAVLPDVMRAVARRGNDRRGNLPPQAPAVVPTERRPDVRSRLDDGGVLVLLLVRVSVRDASRPVRLVPGRDHVRCRFFVRLLLRRHREAGWLRGVPVRVRVLRSFLHSATTRMERLRFPHVPDRCRHPPLREPNLCHEPILRPTIARRRFSKWSKPVRSSSRCRHVSRRMAVRSVLSCIAAARRLRSIHLLGRAVLCRHPKFVPPATDHADETLSLRRLRVPRRQLRGDEWSERDVLRSVSCP